MLRVLTVIGTRPEAIKMAPVIRELRTRNDRIASYVCVTAQHRDLLDQVLGLFEIVPDFDLNLMRPNQTLAQLTSAVLTNLEPILDDVRPDWLLVQGDTTTVMAASLLAFYHNIPVGHIEAGLRTHDKRQPFPEEINRLIADSVADLHFAPTAQSKENLLAEGIPPNSIHVTGNTVIDALLQAVEMPKDTPSPLDDIPEGKRIILLTTHRRENFGEPLSQIFEAVLDIVHRYNDVLIVFPVHPNPNVRAAVDKILVGHPSILLTSPLDYLTLAHTLKQAYIVLTDSGGLQEEAPSLGKPVLVLRNTTERPEAIEAGTSLLIGTQKERIMAAVCNLLDNDSAYQIMARASNPYGDGNASRRIVDTLLSAKCNDVLTAV